MAANFFWSTFVARGPRIGGHETILLTYPTSPSSISPPAKSADWGGGQDLILYEPANNHMITLAPVVPRSHDPKDYVLHLTAIDLGKGPLLLYWMDVSAAKKSAVIMGRLLFEDGSISSDFLISQNNSGQEYAEQIACTGPKHDQVPFYGDYHTAFGYATAPWKADGVVMASYYFFPMWVDPAANGAHYTRVSVSLTTTLGSATAALKPVLPKGVTISAPLTESAWVEAPARATFEELKKRRSVTETEIRAQPHIPR
jgi:hypothetical protein